MLQANDHNKCNIKKYITLYCKIDNKSSKILANNLVTQRNLVLTEFTEKTVLHNVGQE